MSQNYYGSINYDLLLENLKAGKLKTFKTEKGVRLININVFVSDQPDQYENVASVSSPLKEEFHTEEGGKKKNKVFIGNLKKSENSISEATADDFKEDEDDDLPF